MHTYLYKIHSLVSNIPESKPDEPPPDAESASCCCCQLLTAVASRFPLDESRMPPLRSAFSGRDCSFSDDDGWEHQTSAEPLVVELLLRGRVRCCCLSDQHAAAVGGWRWFACGSTGGVSPAIIIMNALCYT